MKTHGKLLVGLVAVTLALSACGSDDDDGDASGPGTTTAPSSGEQCTEERKGGEITVGTLAPTAALDPIQALSGAAGYGMELTALYDTLVRFDKDSGEYKPWVAESLEPNETLDEWTVKLREGVKFGNGDPLTGEAVKFSVERHQSDDNATSSKDIAEQITNIEVVDDRTVVFTLDQPTAAFPTLMADSIGMMVNPAVVGEMTLEEFGLNPPPGAGVGPYTLERLAPEEEAIMRAKDDYWGGPVCIERIRFISVEGGQATYEAFQQGEIDLGFIDGEAPVIADIKDDGVAYYSAVRNAADTLKMNNGRDGTTPPTTDERVRRAVAMALDQFDIDKRVDDGIGLPHSGLLHPDSGLYSGKDGPPFDPDAARALVEEAKADGWDGRIRYAHLPDPRTTERAIAATAMLEAVGFTVERTPVPTVAEIVRLQNETFDFDLVEASLGFEDHAPGPVLRRDLQRVGYSRPEMDEALAELNLATDRAAASAAMAKIQDLWNEDAPMLIWGGAENFIFFSDKIKGLVFNQEAVAMFSDAYIEE